MASQLCGASAIVRGDSLTIIRVLTFFAHSINFVLFCLKAILMVPHCSPDGSGGMPLVPLRIFMSEVKPTFGSREMSFFLDIKSI